jgi:diamine N-acetyltransferase
MQPFFGNLYDRLHKLHQDIAQVLQGLPQDALDWTPATDMNSLAVLVVHTAGAERYWIGDVAGQRPSKRDREAEFQTVGLDAAALLGRLDEAEACAQEVLETLTLADLEAQRTSPRDGRPYTVGWALAHALEHTGLHLGHMQIGRQLWDKWADIPTWLPQVEPTVTPESIITLREVSSENLFAVLKLSRTLTPLQKHMVATNALSIAEAHYEANAWYRAIYADETPVGFLMLHDSPEGWGYFLWRLMVAAPYQRMGFGRRAIELLIEYVKTRPGATTTLTTSCDEGLGSPEGFYRKLGFVRDGKMYDDEVGLSLQFGPMEGPPQASLAEE